jgi:hypothetical protein
MGLMIAGTCVNDRPRGEPAPGGNGRTRADDAPVEDGAFADSGAIGDDGIADERAGADADVLPEDGGGDFGAGGDVAAGADGGARDARAGRDVGGGVDGVGCAEECAMEGEVACRRAEVGPVAFEAVAEDRPAAGDERGEESLLDADGARAGFRRRCGARRSRRRR